MSNPSEQVQSYETAAPMLFTLNDFTQIRDGGFTFLNNETFPDTYTDAMTYLRFTVAGVQFGLAIPGEPSPRLWAAIDAIYATHGVWTEVGVKNA